MSIYKVSEYDYYLPEELIAQEPLTQRDTSRLMVVNKENGNLSHHHFTDILPYLQKGDTLVVNDTKVLPARLFGVRKVTGARIEVLLLKQIEKDNWEVLVKPGKKARVGESILFFNGDKVAMEGVIMDKSDDGGRHIKFTYEGLFLEVLDQIGAMPLPPYIKKKLEDKERYQTVYASNVGSAAAPTAGLHFTPELLQAIKEKGINIVKVLLHVGLGTFRPVKAEDIREHHMHSEFYQVTPEAAEVINATKKNGGRIIAVGTTSVRTLETQSSVDGILHPGSGWTDIFIYPGYKFKCVDGLVTNFHLPKSTLLMLVSAFAGKEEMLKAYESAVVEKYRFFSFGDAMLII